MGSSQSVTIKATRNKSEYCGKCKLIYKFCCDTCKQYIPIAKTPWTPLDSKGKLWCMECKKTAAKNIRFENIGICLCVPGRYAT